MPKLGLTLPRPNRWRTYFLAFVVSDFGSEFTRIALIAKGYTLGGRSVSGAAMVALAQAAPLVIAAPLSGRLADRGLGKRLAIMADVGRFGSLIAVAVANSRAVLLLAAAVSAVLGSVFRPAEARWETNLLESEDDLLAAGGARAALRSTLSVLGPVIAGIVVGTVGPTRAIFFDSLTFLISAALLSQVPGFRPSADTMDAPPDSVRVSTWSVVLSDFSLRALFAIFAVVVLITSMQGPLLYVLFVGEGSSTRSFGFAMASLGFGSLFGAIIINRIPALIEDGPRALVAVLFIDAAALALLSRSRVLPLSYVAMFSMGLIASVFGVVIRYSLQKERYRSHVGSLFGGIEAIEGPMGAASLLILATALTHVKVVDILLGSAVAELMAGAAMLLALFRYRSARHST